MSVTVKLVKRIEAHGETRDQIEFREPTGADVAACGLPFRFVANSDGENEAQPDAKVIAALISRLGNIPKGSVDRLSVGDWMQCMGAVLTFFGQSVPEETLSNGASTLRGFGDGSPESPST